MKKFAAGVLWLLLLSVPYAAKGAPPEIHASLSADTILIGDRFTMEIVISKDMMQAVSLPTFDTDATGRGIEILTESALDTIRQSGRKQVLRKRYELTSFYEGAYDLGHYPVLYADKNITDTLYSPESLPIVVNTLPVDTDNGTIRDIKSPKKAPVLVSEFAGYLVTAAVAAVFIAALVLLSIRMISRRRRTTGNGSVPKPSVPPHVRAIQELETLHNRKLWQSGKTKSYYTGLTDILRTYLSDRYGLNAREMTSEEIMQATAPLHLPEKGSKDLRAILVTADLVKFARQVPKEETNESLYYAAYYFVEDTKETPEPSAPEADGGKEDEK